MTIEELSSFEDIHFSRSNITKSLSVKMTLHITSIPFQNQSTKNESNYLMYK